MIRPRVVLFDLGNVLVSFQPDRFWEAVAETDPESQLRIGADLKEMGRGYESGMISTDEFRREFVRIIGRTSFDDSMERAFLSVLPTPIEGMEEIVRETAQKAATALVSNTSPLHFEHCLRTVPALRHIQRFYLSYHLKALKPDQAFYRAVIAGEACDAREMVFVDDVADNVSGAEQAGMAGILFEGAHSLAGSLRSLGL